MDVEAMNIDALSISGHKVHYEGRGRLSGAQIAYALSLVA